MDGNGNGIYIYIYIIIYKWMVMVSIGIDPYILVLESRCFPTPARTVRGVRRATEGVAVLAETQRCA